MKSMYYTYVSFAFVVSTVIAGCGFTSDTSKEPSADGIQSLAWSLTATNPLDAGSGLVVAPQVAVEPDPADNDGAGTDDGSGSAVAVWLEQVDENPFDNLPPITHLYARRSIAGVWAITDAACPTDGRLENTNGNGVCVVDAVTDTYDASAPKVAMDKRGNAVLVWEQSDGTDCSTAGGVQPCTRIQARTFNGTVWSTTTTLLSLGGNAPAVDPDIAVEPDPADNAGGDDVFSSAIAVFSQWDGAAWAIQAARCLDDRVVVDAGTACGDTASEWGATGTGYIDGGSYYNNSPRIGMDVSGNATVAWIRFAPGSCIVPNTGAGAVCYISRVYVNRTNTGGSVWGGATPISPGVTIGCSDGPLECIGFGQLRIARGGTTSFVVFKAFEWATPGGVSQATTVYGNLVTNTTSANTALASGATGCSSFNSGSEGAIMNCDLNAPDVAVEPDSGATAIAVYEQYDGTRSAIWANRYSAGWGGAVAIDAGGTDAYSPRIGMDNAGNAVAVWVQKAGAAWRIYSRTFTASTVTWGAAAVIDGGVGSQDHYYNPVVAMEAPTPASALSVFIGQTVISNFTTTRLYSVTGP